MKKWIVNALHGVNFVGLAAFMPSAFGVGHALVFGGRQEDALKPVKR